MIRTLRSIAYRTDDLGALLGEYSDRVIAAVAAGFPAGDLPAIARCVTTAFGGLGYAGIEPKAFPGMFAAYNTSNRGRGDHTYAWTIQAEEGGLEGAEDLAAYVAAGQEGKALVDSLGLCDFFTADVVSDPFLSMFNALTGFEPFVRFPQGLRPEDLRRRAPARTISRGAGALTTLMCLPS